MWPSQSLPYFTPPHPNTHQHPQTCSSQPNPAKKKQPDHRINACIKMHKWVLPFIHTPGPQEWDPRKSCIKTNHHVLKSTFKDVLCTISELRHLLSKLAIQVLFWKFSIGSVSPKMQLNKYLRYLIEPGGIIHKQKNYLQWVEALLKILLPSTARVHITVAEFFFRKKWSCKVNWQQTA